MSPVTLDVANSGVSSPLVYLPPELAHQVNVALYIHIGSTTLLIWDVLNNLRNDYRILSYYKAGFQTIVYFITRITLLVYALGRTVLLTAPMQDCGKLQMVLSGFLAVFVSGTMLSFYLRVYALYPDNRRVKILYGVWWFAVVGMSGTFALSFTAEHLGPTDYCIEGVKGHFLGPTAILLLVSDSFTYVAVTYRLYNLFLDSESNTQERLRLVVFGASLPIFWKVVLLDSQLYFMVNLFTKVLLVFTVHLWTAPRSVMFFICHLVLANILSGRIFRTIKMNYDRVDGPSLSEVKTSLVFAGNPNLGTRRSTQITFPSSKDVVRSDEEDSEMEKGVFHKSCARLDVALGESIEVKWRAFLDESAKEGSLHAKHLL
ncbi:hypothetical protein CPC08DRAFT_462642 [Agrocybe pediades]|nr:hypothetical protein CPC08DRAFT_462642 [Agrocybe pediades]